MTGFCVMGLHEQCPDTDQDSYACSCPCHIDQNSNPQQH